MKLLILGANGQIARLVTKRILTEAQFETVSLTLGLRNHYRLAKLYENPRVGLKEVDLEDAAAVTAATQDQDMIFVAVNDHSEQNRITKNVIQAMQTNQVQRVIFTNVLGIYNEVPGRYGRWVRQQLLSGLKGARLSDQLLAELQLNYTTLRLPWLNDRDEVKYQLTTKHEQYLGVSVSRKSVADLVLRIVEDSSLGLNDSLGIADPDTQGESRPVY